MPRAVDEITQIRQRWADITNEHLREAGLELRVSHVRQASDYLKQQERPWLPRIAWVIEKRGGHSVVGDRVRQQSNEQQEAWEAVRNGSLEDIARQSTEKWAAYRSGMLSERNPETQQQRDSLRRELGNDGFSL